MPLGFERLNERSQRPNTLINFVKPLEGPDKAIAEDFLQRIAAQCYPVMKAAHISVMSLEEFPPNNEFLGRNFNAGECIQLVLKDKSGRWLGFKYVQMVMMHELAHCKQMNHSRYFWQVRNQYSQEMYDLWAKKYLGEGVWGRGRALISGSFVMDRELTAGDVPEHLCGGTYRRRGRKRKRGAADTADGQRPNYAERQQKRIAKKFGKHGDGNALGEDDLIRGALEQGHRHQGKPRVANSKRGRELRAQAALARFDAAKSKTTTVDEETDVDASDIDWSDTDSEDDATEVDENGFVKVCGEENEEDEDANNEMEELRAMTDKKTKPKTAATTSLSASDDHKTKSNTKTTSTVGRQKVTIDLASHPVDDRPRPAQGSSTVKDEMQRSEHLATTHQRQGNPALCKVCSLENEQGTLLCLACGHVLRPKLVKDTWRCQSEACKNTAYLNAGDVGRCGICGSAKPVVSAAATPAGGLISSDVLRWD